MTSDKPGYLFRFLYFNLNETKKIIYEQYDGEFVPMLKMLKLKKDKKSAQECSEVTFL